MVQLVVFVNLFFVPMLPLYMIYQKKQKTLELRLGLLFQYCIITACNIPLAKVFIFLIKKINGVFISIDSGYYTLAALASAFLIYVIYIYWASDLNRKYWIELCLKYKTHIQKKFWSEKVAQRGVKRILRELVPAYFLIFASCFMMLIFEPILMYTTNIDDFWFDFSIMIWPVLGVFFRFLLGGILITTTIYFVNLFFSEGLILYKVVTLIGYIVYFLLYVQGNWLAGNLPPLTGAEIVWGNYGKFENTVLIGAFVFLSAAAVICIRKIKTGRTIRCAAIGSSVISVILIASLIPVVVENEALKSKNTFAATVENLNTVSSNQNFLIFLLDTVDSQMCYEVMKNDKDFRGMFDDFTYYPDVLSVFPHTRDSIPNILTGAVNHNVTSFINYSSRSYNQSPLFKKLTQNDYGINLYSPMISWAGQRSFEIENSASIYDIKMDFIEFMNQELKYIRFKYFPYGFKQWSRIETLDFNLCKETNSAQSEYYSWGNWANYANIQENNVLDKRSKNYFQFIHCEGVHTPYNMDKSLNSVEEGTQDQKIAASLTIIKAYLQRLKENDVYDNSIIIIMSDHGSIYTMEDYEQPYLFLARCNPILFIKGANEKHEMIESDRPVSYLDLQGAFCDLIDGKQSTELFTELESGRKRTVLWHIWTEEYHMVEYETTEKAWEPEKFIPTGKVYNLKE